MNRELVRMALAGIGLGLLAALYVLVPDAGHLGVFTLASAMAILAAMVWFPEAVLFGYLFAGRYLYDPRLAPANSVVSLNQMLLGALLVLMVVHRKHLVASFRLWSVRGLLLFVACLLGWSTWTLGPEYGAEKVSRYLGVVVPSVLVGMALAHWRGHLMEALLAAWGLGLGLAIIGALTYSPDAFSEAPERTTALGSGPIVFARSVGLAVLVSALLLVSTVRGWRARKSRSWFLLAIIAVTLVSLAVAVPGFVRAQSRGPVVAIIFALAVYTLLVGRGDWRRIALVLILSGAGLAVALQVVAQLSGPSRYDLGEEGSTVTSFEERKWMLEQTYDLVLEQPMLGVGTGGWPVAVFGIDQKKYPHNFFAEIAAEQGLVVCALLVLLFLGLPLLAIKTYLEAGATREREVLLLTITLYVYTLGTVQFSGDIVDNRTIWLMLGLMEIARHHAQLADQGELPMGASLLRRLFTDKV